MQVREQIKTVVHNRAEWKREIGRLNILRELNQVGLVGKEPGKIQPHEVINDWTFVFFTNDQGQGCAVELKD